MLLDLLRRLLALIDVRAWARLLTRQARVDVVFIANLRDDAERRQYFGNLVPTCGHADGARIYHDGVAGRMRFIYSTGEEMASEYGSRKARAQVVDACRWAEQRGARVVLLGGSTATLFGRDGAVLKELFPKLLFTTGINATAYLQWADVKRALQGARLEPQRSRVLVAGPYGLLGFHIARKLLKSGYQLVASGADEDALAAVVDRLGISTAASISSAGEVDAVVSCLSSNLNQLSRDDTDQLRRAGRKLLVVDLAAPPNMDAATCALCRETIVHQGASHAAVPHLHYVLGSVTRRLLGLPSGVNYSCFAEAMSLYYAIHQLGRQELLAMDWLKLSDACMAQIGAAFSVTSISLAAARSYGHVVQSFDLRLASELPHVEELATTEFHLAA